MPGLLARVGGDTAAMHGVIALFLEDTPPLVATLREKLDAKDTAAVLHLAHALKGSASNFDATTVTALAKDLEARARAGDLAAAQSVFLELDAEVSRLLTSLERFRRQAPCVS
jgi:HPt (histidine-containing phosphotransfer) domain-containing protein